MTQQVLRISTKKSNTSKISHNNHREARDRQIGGDKANFWSDSVGENTRGAQLPERPVREGEEKGAIFRRRQPGERKGGGQLSMGRYVSQQRWKRIKEKVTLGNKKKMHCSRTLLFDPLVLSSRHPYAPLTKWRPIPEAITSHTGDSGSAEDWDRLLSWANWWFIVKSTPRAQRVKPTSGEAVSMQREGSTYIGGQRQLPGEERWEGWGSKKWHTS